jgi:hypothetical protein
MNINSTIFNQIFGRFISPLKTGIIINSYGRSGSTMLRDSILSGLPGKLGTFKNNLFRSVIKQQAWDLNTERIARGFIYKTHDYPPSKSFDRHIRVIYIFSNPINVILSLLLLQNKCDNDWFKEHFEHLKAPYRDPQKMIYEDVFRIENHLDQWLMEERFPVAFIRYENLWEYQTQLSQFCNAKISLPPFRKRSDKSIFDEKIVNEIKLTYKSLIAKIDNFENLFFNSFSIKST